MRKALCSSLNCALYPKPLPFLFIEVTGTLAFPIVIAGRAHWTFAVKDIGTLAGSMLIKMQIGPAKVEKTKSQGRKISSIVGIVNIYEPSYSTVSIEGNYHRTVSLFVQVSTSS